MYKYFDSSVDYNSLLLDNKTKHDHSCTDLIPEIWKLTVHVIYIFSDSKFTALQNYEEVCEKWMILQSANDNTKSSKTFGLPGESVPDLQCAKLLNLMADQWPK